jgi:hypothetical protein
LKGTASSYFNSSSDVLDGFIVDIASQSSESHLGVEVRLMREA